MLEVVFNVFPLLNDEATVSTPSTPQRSNFSVVSRTTQNNSSAVANATNSKRQAAKVQSTASISLFNRSDVIPVVVPRHNPRLDQAVESRKEDIPVKNVLPPLQSKASDFRKFINARDDFERLNVSSQPDNELPKAMDLGFVDRSCGTSVKSSTTGVAAVERKSKDEKPMIPRKVDTNATIDALGRYQHENCMYSFIKMLFFHILLFILSILVKVSLFFGHLMVSTVSLGGGAGTGEMRNKWVIYIFN